jgi:GT2 family glycosyltransferase
VDGTEDQIKVTESRAKLRVNTVNRGFATSVNRLAADFDEDIDYLLLINPDVELAPDAIDQLIAASLAIEAEAIIGGRMMRQDGIIDPTSCLAEPSLWQSAAFAFGLRRWPGCEWFDPDALGGWHRTGIRAVPVLTGAMLLISRRLWQRVGGSMSNTSSMGRMLTSAFERKDCQPPRSSQALRITSIEAARVRPATPSGGSPSYVAR